MLCVNCGQGYQVNDGKLIKDATVNSEEPKGGIFSKIFVKESLDESVDSDLDKLTRYHLGYINNDGNLALYRNAYKSADEVKSVFPS